MKKTLILLLFPLFAFCQIPQLLKDISTIGYGGPTSYVEMAGIVYFIHNDDIHGNELWRTDGTASGTYMVKDIYFGSWDGLGKFEDLVVFQNKLYFAARDKNFGRELYKSDGTAAGTTIVIDINSGAADSQVRSITNCGDYKLVFVAQNTTYGNELWQSDGSLTGTTILADFETGSPSSTIFEIVFMPTPLAGTIFVNVLNDNFNKGIWKSSFSCFIGCGAFSPFIKIPNTANSFYLLKHTNTINNQYDLYFRNSITSNISKYNLNTDILTPLTSFSSPTYINSSLNTVGNTVVFAGGDLTNGVELWKTDGTVAGTGLLKDINPGPASSDFKDFEIAGNSVYFAVENINGTNLWRTDGTANGTVQVIDIDPTDEIKGVFNITIQNDNIYFFTYKPILFYEVEIQFRVYNTSSQTYTLLKDFGTGGELDGAPEAFPYNGSMLFSGYDDINGFEVWKTSGSVTTTQLLKDINKGRSYFNYLTFNDFTKEILFFTQENPNSYSLYKIELGTVVSKIKDIYLEDLTLLNANTYVFNSYESNTGSELWKTDGTAAGTVLLKDLNPNGSSEPNSFTKLNNSLIFRATTTTTGGELWITDGTAAGTNLIKDIYPGTTWSYPRDFKECNGYVYFIANTQAEGEELWRTDGTNAGTTLVKDVLPGSGSSQIKHLTKVGNKLFFVSTNTVYGEELFVTDGTSAGTILVKDIRPGFLSSNIQDLTAVGNDVFFSADDGVNGKELWRSSGTNATTLIYNINPEHTFQSQTIIESSNPQNLTALNNKLYFSAEKSIYTGSAFIGYGRELWSLDIGIGQPILVRDANTPPSSDGIPIEYTQSFTRFGNIIYYPATDGQHGFELWRSDGTEAGTFMVQDLYEGINNGIDYQANQNMIGNPYAGFFYYNATNGQNGHELWAFGQCKTSQNITTTIAASSQRQQSSQFLTSLSNITNTNIMYGNLDINYRAGKAITLLPGFSVEGIKLPQNRRTVFKAEIGGCNY
jgi:trimeric autotransporter adhesin